MAKDNGDRELLFAKASVLLNATLAIGKIIAGIFSLSLFLCVHALYNVGIALAKTVAVEGRNAKGESASGCEAREMDSCSCLMGWFVLASSIAYIVYSVRLFIGVSSVSYPKIIAIAIAAFSFTELGMSVHGLITSRWRRQPFVKAIKLINLATSLTSLALTQAAIMSFAYEGDAAYFVGLTGMVFGCCAAFVGLYLIFMMRRVLPGMSYAEFLRSAPSIVAQCALNFVAELAGRKKRGLDNAAIGTSSGSANSSPARAPTQACLCPRNRTQACPRGTSSCTPDGLCRSCARCRSQYS